jgi:hypothetical protein
MKRGLVLVACLALAATLAAPATAGAGQGSALDQYIESVPGAEGDNPSRNLPGQNGGGHGGASLPSSAQESLQQLGQAGQETAALATATSPAGPGDENQNGAGGSSVGTSGNADAGGDDGVLAAVTRLFDPAPGGVGLLLPLTLVGTLVIAIAFVLRRRMGKSDTVS